MSVPSFKRRTSSFKVIDEGVHLSEELLRMLSKETLFPKRSRWLFCGEFANEVNKFLTDILTANNIRVINSGTYKKRRTLQEDAISLLRVMNEKLMVSSRLFKFDVAHIKQPALDLDSELKLMFAWVKSDVKRYCDEFGTKAEKERIEKLIENNFEEPDEED